VKVKLTEVYIKSIAKRVAKRGESSKLSISLAFSNKLLFSGRKLKADALWCGKQQ